ncbi:DUF775-domain-containing protein [Rickenella mellea]|uniref:DUF775-domain-containing protein n=1 Tax=Rickenella mellea TaxID=50990 RepID=A0A4Y7Q1E3_9AGAM|nr:DUF775-domain-containing protein [Rickenella mellea]
MFGCVVAGRLLQTNLQQIDDSHAIFELPSASTINHICVFLLGNLPFPEGYGAAVHFHWPGKGFQLLGMISNDKPSAIFRLRGTYSSSTPLSHAAFSNPGTPADVSMTDVPAVLGISVEPIPAIVSQLASLPSSLTPSRGVPGIDLTLLAERIVKHLFNYLSSFATGSSGTFSPENYVQLGTISKWYENFVNKVKVGGIGFLERDD